MKKVSIAKQQLADQNFEPVPGFEPGQPEAREQHNENLDEILFVSRIAFRLLGLTKGTVIENLRDVMAEDDRVAPEMLQSFIRVRGLVETLGTLLEAAELRYAVALAAVEQHTIMH